MLALVDLQAGDPGCPGGVPAAQRANFAAPQPSSTMSRPAIGTSAASTSSSSSTSASLLRSGVMAVASPGIWGRVSARRLARPAGRLSRAAGLSTPKCAIDERTLCIVEQRGGQTPRADGWTEDCRAGVQQHLAQRQPQAGQVSTNRPAPKLTLVHEEEAHRAFAPPCLGQGGHFLTTWHAPTGPQVHHHRSPSGCRPQIDGMATPSVDSAVMGIVAASRAPVKMYARGPHQHAGRGGDSQRTSERRHPPAPPGQPSRTRQCSGYRVPAAVAQVQHRRR